MLDYNFIGQSILDTGKMKVGRNGNTLSKLAPQFRHDLSEGFPLDTTRKINFTVVKNELLWFISGRCHNVTLLNAMGTHIWDKWADQTGYLGPIYGVQWRRWQTNSTTQLDQIQDAINRLRNNPYDRRAIVSAWNPADIRDMALPPCHVMFQLIYDGRLNLHMYQRSADWMIGVPYNIASYALLLHMLAGVLNMTPGELIISYGDAHIYEEHIADSVIQFKRMPRPLPILELSRMQNIDAYTPDDINLQGYDPHPAIDYAVKE